MKKDFVSLFRKLTIAINPEISEIKDGEYFKPIKQIPLEKIESILHSTLLKEGYSIEEYDNFISSHHIDVSSSNPDEWIIEPLSLS